MGFVRQSTKGLLAHLLTYLLKKTSHKQLRSVAWVLNCSLFDQLIHNALLELQFISETDDAAATLAEWQFWQNKVTLNTYTAKCHNSQS